MSDKLSNIPLHVFRQFLIAEGFVKIRINGGHEVWSRSDLNRPVIIQTHENPVPEFIIRNNLRDIGINRKEFFALLKKHKIKV